MLHLYGVSIVITFISLQETTCATTPLVIGNQYKTCQFNEARRWTNAIDGHYQAVSAITRLYQTSCYCGI